MASRKSGRLAIVASLAGFTPLAEAPAYAASKAAAYSYGHSLRRLLIARGITVTVISPGFVDTPMSRSLPYSRPFLMTADEAAELIVPAIDRGSPDLIFPWPLRLAAALHGVLPLALSDRLMASLARSAKSPE
jgi:short-subunit dehydrogenase